MYRWLKQIKIKGRNKFIKDYKKAKKRKKTTKKTDVLTKLKIYKIREEKKNCCREKIQYFLKKIIILKYQFKQFIEY